METVRARSGEQLGYCKTFAITCQFFVCFLFLFFVLLCFYFCLFVLIEVPATHIAQWKKAVTDSVSDLFIFNLISVENLPSFA